MTALTATTGTPGATISTSRMAPRDVVVAVGLGERERDLGTARVGERDELLDAAGPHGHVERPHDDHDVDVGRHDAGVVRLGGAGGVAGVADEGRAALEPRGDAVAVEGDPVADGQVVAGQAQLVRRRGERDDAAIDPRHAGRVEMVAERCELGAALGVEAERGEVIEQGRSPVSGHR